MPIDPITAVNNCITAFFSFLQTPAGQKFAMDQIAIGEKFNAQLAKFFDHIQTQIDAQNAPKTPGA